MSDKFQEKFTADQEFSFSSIGSEFEWDRAKKASKQEEVEEEEDFSFDSIVANELDLLMDDSSQNFYLSSPNL